MATENVATAAPAALKTREWKFHPAGWERGGLADMFSVNGGMPIHEALELARCCTSTVQGLSFEMVSGGGKADGDLAFACQVLSTIAYACLAAVPDMEVES